jgi:transcriptional regulator with XRE-family HTH domain
MGRQTIGVAVHRWRMTLGLTQEQVADALSAEVGRDQPFTKQYISLIERGQRAVDRRSILIGLARVLGVSVTDLTGQPYPATDRSDADGYVVAQAIRDALDDADEPDPMGPRPIELLRFASDLAMAARMACDLKGVGAHVPSLLTDTRALYFGQGDERAGRLLVQAAFTASLVLKPAGFIDLAVRCAELAERVAEQLGDPVLIGAAAFARAQCALASGHRRRSYEVATAAMGGLERPARIGHEALTLLGMLHLHAGLTAAGQHRADAAHAHWSEANALARRVEGDPWRLEFGEANVALWRLGYALENGEPGRAPELARLVDPTALRTPQRVARLHLDTGRGLFFLGQHDEAVEALLRADEVAPGDLRNRGTAVEIAASLVRDVSRSGGSPAVAELARRCGVDPVALPEDID